MHDIRGNLNTRLAKLDAVDSKYAGIVLAQAGLERLGWQNRINHTIEPNEILYAVGQGALAVECRTSDTKIMEMLEKLICHQTQCRILAERSFLKTLGGGCSAPVAVHSILSKRKHSSDEITPNSELRMIGSVWSLDGKTEIQAENTCKLHVTEKNDANDDDDDAVVPSKIIKLSVEVGDTNDLKSDQPSPPQIIDHSQLNLKSGNDLNQNLDIAGIMSVHNDAFKKCPYSALAESNKSAATVDGKTPANLGAGDLKCPLHFEIGEDVMGKCPYVDSTNELMTKSTASIGSCPFKNGANKTDSNANEDSSTKCPLNSIDLKKCPFLNPTPSSSQDRPTSTDTDLVNESAIETLFCGIYPHRCWPIQVFEQCEQLGKQLASQLIDKGALAVMECAQNEIRQKI